MRYHTVSFGVVVRLVRRLTFRRVNVFVPARVNLRSEQAIRTQIYLMEQIPQSSAFLFSLQRFTLKGLLWDGLKVLRTVRL
jgi:hypothetical protein